MREQFVEAAVLSDQVDCALFADAGYPGDVVAGISDERQDGGHLRRLDPEFFDDTLFVEPRPVFARIVNADTVMDELKEVLVDGDDGHLESMRGGALCERADDVVRLVASGGDNRHAHRFACLVYPVDLLRQIVGHGNAIGFVVVHDSIAERRTGKVE